MTDAPVDWLVALGYPPLDATHRPNAHHHGSTDGRLTSELSSTIEPCLRESRRARRKAPCGSISTQWDSVPGAYAAIPWLLVHECICHVPARQGGKNSNASPFAEGFMDWAACFFFERWMDQIDASLSLAASQSQGLIDRTLTRPETSEGAARLRGRSAAKRIVTWLRNDHGYDEERAKAWVAKFATDLNCHEASLAKKDSFVVALNSRPWSGTAHGQPVGRARWMRDGGQRIIMQLHKNSD